VVSTDYSDIRRILPCPGQVVSPRSAEGLARAVRWAHRERATIVARQRQWVQAHATIAQAAANLEQVYRAYAGPASPVRAAPLRVREGRS
jgi:glycosyltransferase involved in cell wall biosynthesis